MTVQPIGTEIRRVRGALGLTLEAFSELVGIPWQTVAAYEAGRTTPPADRLLVIVHHVQEAGKPFRVGRVAREISRQAEAA